MINEVYNIDCMEFMSKCKDNEFDLSICDPPYGIGIDGQKKSISNNPKHNRKEHIKKDWDNNIPEKKYFNELFRISKNQIIWGANYFVKHLNEGHKGWIIWDKAQHGLTMSDCELAYSSFDFPTRIYVQNRCILLQEGNTIHPTQKPVALYRWLLQNYAKPNDKIFDSHVGSGSSRIACYELGFDFIGCELDKDYWEAQEKRYTDIISQQRIF